MPRHTLMLQMVIMGLIVGSLFFSVPPDRSGVRTLLGASFICLMFLAFGSAPELGLLMMNRRWVVRQALGCAGVGRHAWCKTGRCMPATS